MTRPAGRRTHVPDPTWFRLLLGGGVVLALVATVLVIVSDETKWLRLAVLAALWAALLAAFALSRSRRDAKIAELRRTESKRTYELELQREVTARREHENRVVEEARQQADERHREELAGLREQLDRLTHTLSGLFDGDVLVERMTLSAESTRVRQLGGERVRMMGPAQVAGAPGQYGALPAAGPVISAAPVPPVPPRAHAVPRPAPSEDDTVQIDLLKIAEHAAAVDAVADDDVIDAGPAEVVDAEIVDADVTETVAEAQPVEAEAVETERVEMEESAEDAAVTAAEDAAPAEDAEIEVAEIEEPVENGAPAGDHTSHQGAVSVSDLLAAYGRPAGSSRRRRRSDDED